MANQDININVDSTSTVQDTENIRETVVRITSSIVNRVTASLNKIRITPVPEIEDLSENSNDINLSNSSYGLEDQRSYSTDIILASSSHIKKDQITKNVETKVALATSNTATTSLCVEPEKNETKKAEDTEFCAKISNHSSNISIMCRICYDDTLDEPIISPCKCKGSVGMMHKSCLEKWLAESNTNKCDLCFHKFETERTTKYTVNQSVYRWLRYPPSSFAFPIRDMRSDMVTCIVLIPFSCMLVYLCLFAAEYYNRQHFSVIPVARWTAISVMFMGIVIVLGFCIWIYLVLRYHSRVWYFWWQRETIVRINFKPVVEEDDNT